MACARAGGSHALRWTLRSVTSTHTSRAQVSRAGVMSAAFTCPSRAAAHVGSACTVVLFTWLLLCPPDGGISGHVSLVLHASACSMQRWRTAQCVSCCVKQPSSNKTKPSPRHTATHVHALADPKPGPVPGPVPARPARLPSASVRCGTSKAPAPSANTLLHVNPCRPLQPGRVPA